MNLPRSPRQRRDFAVGAVVSVVVHGAFFVALIVMAILAPEDEEDPEIEEEEAFTEVVYDEDPFEPEWEEEEELDVEEAEEDQRDDEEEREEDEPDEEEEEEEDEETEDEEEEEEEEQPEEEEEEEQEEEPEEEEEREEPLEAYAVEQLTNEEEPDDAEHISDQANRTDEEMVSDTTTIEDVEETHDPEALEQDADTELEMAMQATEQPEPPEILDPDSLQEDEEDEEDTGPDEEPTAERQPEPAERQEESEERREYRDPSEIITHDDSAEEEAPPVEEQADHDALFGENSERAEEIMGSDGERQDPSDGSRSQGRRLLANWKENEEAMRASLENFLSHVETGNHTTVNARQSDHASYIARMHRTIHNKWALQFLPRIQSNFSRNDRLNDPDLKAIIEIVIDAETGEIEETGRVMPSGHTLFDAEALNITRNLPDQPDPPDSIVSPNGKVYIHWTFWRDPRQCGTFGVRIYQLNESDEQ